MLLKKLVAVVSAVVVIAVPYVKVLADDTVITLDETAKKFVVIDKNLEYRDMLPGEERSSVIKISNSSAENMEFYINGKVLDNLADKGTGDQTAVVAGNFPNSQTFTEIKLAECKMAIGAGAQEVDVVISVGDILEKNYEKVYRELKAIRKVCENVRLKVILETGELKDLESIFNASLIAAYAGADFIKTSTGKVPVNATPESVYVMCEAIRQYYAQTGKRIGLKVAGGVSKAQNAIRYLTIVNHVLGCEWLTPYYFRIGASQLMDDIVKEIKALQMIK